MDLDLVRKMIWSQFAAALQMLENAVAACSHELWDDALKGKPFWYTAYHALFFADLYLSDSLQGFKPPDPFTNSEMDPKGVMPERTYSKAELLSYVEYCRTKGRAAINHLTEAKLAEKSPFRWVDVNNVELFFYNTRHIQHHTGQLDLILRQRLDRSSKWVFKAELV